MVRNSKWTVLQSRLGIINKKIKQSFSKEGADNAANLSNVISPFETFQWSLHFLRTIFQIIGQDIFQENYRYKFAFYFIIFSAAATNVCYFSTVFDDEHYDNAMRFNCAAMLFGIIQVK